jgi:hypothetical protein
MNNDEKTIAILNHIRWILLCIFGMVTCNAFSNQIHDSVKATAIAKYQDNDQMQSIELNNQLRGL